MRPVPAHAAVEHPRRRPSSRVDWSRPRDFNAHTLERPASGYRVAWIISPPSRTSGGHQNAFRFMSFLERAGNPTTVYLYSPAKYPVVSIDGIRADDARDDGVPRDHR